MGSPATEAGRKDDELQHEVVIEQRFWLGERPVTQRQYEALMGANPSMFKGRNRPVENVSHDDALEYCRRLSKHIGRAARLPTEAEWEYACRAGRRTPFNTGTGIRVDQANFNSEVGSSDTGRFAPNAWGLYDMHGNVQEWCADWYGPYAGGTSTDPGGPTAGKSRVLRGGGWRHPPENLRSARRGQSPPKSRARDIGFRVLIETREDLR